MTKPVLRRRTLMLAGAPALAAPMLAAGIARAADDWPNKTVRYVCLFPAGGPTDTMSRIICQALTELSGQQFIVENRSGSGGNVGADAIAKAAPDGYTMGMYSVASHAISPTLYARLPFDAAKDFTPISMLWTVMNMLMARLELPANSLQELIALAKANPGKHSFASSGAGTTPHLCGELLKQLAGVNMLHVPYRGGAPAYQDLMANNVDIMFDNIPGPMALYRSGKVRGLAVTGKQRHPSVPELPTMGELLPGFEITSWSGLCGPAGIPRPIVEKCSMLVKKALESETVKAAFDKQGATPLWASAADTAAFRAAEEQRLAPIIKASGAKVE